MIKISDTRILELIDYTEEAVVKNPEDFTFDMMSALEELKELREKCRLNNLIKSETPIADICRIISLKDNDFKSAKTVAERNNVKAEVKALFDEAWEILGRRMEGYHRTISDELSGR